MKKLSVSVAILAITAVPALAQSHSHGSMHAPDQKQAQMPMAAGALADGEVRKIDKDAGKITLKHGPIKSLDMPPMTMVFHVKDRAMLDKVKVGEKVRFAAEDKGGMMTVMAIEAAK